MNARAGFSLVELVCAIFILGIGLAGLVQGITTALASSKEAERHTTAAFLAEGRVELLRGEGFLIRGVEEGEFDENFSAYRWKETVAEKSPEGLFEVQVAILSSNSGRVIYELDTLLFQPPVLSSSEEESTTNGGQQGNQRERARR